MIWETRHVPLSESEEWPGEAGCAEKGGRAYDIGLFSETSQWKELGGPALWGWGWDRRNLLPFATFYEPEAGIRSPGTGYSQAMGNA